MKGYAANRVMSGTWGQAWLDGILAAEVNKAKATLKYNKTEIVMCGQMGVGTKVTGFKGSGSLGMHKLNSRMLEMLSGKITDGIDARFDLILAIDDPDAFGAERIYIPQVSFDDLTLADWEAGKAGTIEVPFTFDSYQVLESVTPI